MYEQPNKPIASSLEDGRQAASESHVVSDWLKLPENDRWLVIYYSYDGIMSFNIRTQMPNLYREVLSLLGCAPLGTGLEIDQMSEENSPVLLKKSTRSGPEDVKINDDGSSPYGH